MEDRRLVRADVGGGISAIPTTILVLTATCAAAIYRAAAAGDAASVAFVVVSYGALLLLLRLLRAYELAPPDAAAERGRLRRGVWVLCTLLTAMFAWKVAGVVPWPAAVLVWAAATATAAGGFFALFPRRGQ